MKKYSFKKRWIQAIQIIAAFGVCIPFFCIPPAEAFIVHSHTEQGNISIRSECRQYSQGEALMLLLEAPPFNSAVVSWRGQEHLFVSNERKGQFFAIVPLGLNMQPGGYDLTVSLTDTNHRLRHFPLKITLSKGAFPSTKLKVKKRFTAPSEKHLKRIKKEQALLQKIYATYTPHWLGNGECIAPLQQKMTDTFGEHRIFNDGFRSRHRGIDIRSPRGTSIRASNGGSVILARNLYFGGNTVIIDHGIGLFSIYCHLDKITVTERASIKKGATIGCVGATGRATGPHLHWGFRLRNRYVNPLSILHLPF